MTTLIAAILSLFSVPEVVDTMRTADIEEVVIVSTPKESQRLRHQPLASTSLSQDAMLERGVSGVKDFSALVPNLFIPDYGSHLTTSIYARGVGSRIGTPSVALYVDGVPQVSSASYDFNFSNVDRVDILRGPQSTLYGRNSMGGVIRVYTKNPMHYQGTDILFDAGHVVGKAENGSLDGIGRYKLNLTHYHLINERFAFTGHLFGDIDGGYFCNEARSDERIDESKDMGARMRFIFKPQTSLNFDLSISHEWLKQGGYPYEYRGIVGAPSTPDPSTPIGHIAYDNRSGYRRNLTNVGLTAEKCWPQVTLASVTGFQHLHDRMDLDQDFTDTNLYTLMQRQNSNTVSEELMLKPAAKDLATSDFNYSWLLGLNTICQWTSADAPVTFHDDGLDWLNGLINRQANTHLPTITSYDGAGHEQYTMNFLFNDVILGSDLAFPGMYKTPSANMAAYHQSTFNNLFGLEHLNLTAGLRLEYERFVLDHEACYAFGQLYGLNGRMTYPDGSVREGMTLVPERTFSVEDLLDGKHHKDDLQLLPRLTLQYAFLCGNGSPRSNVYVTVSRGYRSGGYNIQMFNELLQSRMQAAIMHNVAEATIPVVESVAMIPADVKAKVRDMLQTMGTQGETDVQGATWYKPERTWNFEVGGHFNLFDARLQADVSAFIVDTRDQQVSKMTTGGLGRITVNSGISLSAGCESSLRAMITDDLSFDVAYGFTHAKFRNDDLRTFVPFVPRHTLAIGLTQLWTLPSQAWLEHVRLHADYRGAGRIYWNEANSASRNFAGTLNARLSADRGIAELSLYAYNILSTRYQEFYFETMQRGFAQYTRPAELGLQLRLRF